MSDFVDPYFDVDNNCLRNLLGITDADQLARAEAEIVGARVDQVDKRIKPPTSVADWKATHRQLFGDIYVWAGEFRTVDITKDGHRFHPGSHLDIAAEYCATQMRTIAALTNPGAELLSEQLATLLSDMNETHPFREGNGRTQRQIIGHLARHHGHPIAWRAISPEQNIELSIAATDKPTAFAHALRTGMDAAHDYRVTRPTGERRHERNRGRMID